MSKCWKACLFGVIFACLIGAVGGAIQVSLISLSTMISTTTLVVSAWSISWILSIVCYIFAVNILSSFNKEGNNE